MFGESGPVVKRLPDAVTAHGSNSHREQRRLLAGHFGLQRFDVGLTLYLSLNYSAVLGQRVPLRVILPVYLR